MKITSIFHTAAKLIQAFLILLICLHFFLGFKALGQSNFDKAQSFIEDGDYASSLSFLEEEIMSPFAKADAFFQAGICKLMLQQPKDALDLMLKAVEMDEATGGDEKWLWLGLAYQEAGRSKDAVRQFNRFTPPTEAGLDLFKMKMLEKSLNEVSKRKNPDDNAWYYVSNLGPDINTQFGEHSPCLEENGKTLWFTSTRPGVDDRRGGFGVYEDIMFSKVYGKHQWNAPDHMPGIVNSDHNEGVIQVFDNGNKMLLFRHNNGGDLYQAEKNGISWGKPYPLKKINSMSSESNAFLSKDGNTLIFASNRDSETGHFDLYYSERNHKGKWGKAQPLPGNVNTKSGDEDAPFLSEDGKQLYFSSNGHNGFGGFDIFVSEWDSERKLWKTPRNLGNPINSFRDDLFFSMDEKSGIGYFASNRIGGFGMTDLYQVRKVTPLNLEGKVIIENQSTPASNIYLAFQSEHSRQQQKVLTDPNGTFIIPLETNQAYKVSFYRLNESKELVKIFDDVYEAPVQSANRLYFEFYIPYSAWINSMAEAEQNDGIKP